MDGEEVAHICIQTNRHTRDEGCDSDPRAGGGVDGGKVSPG